MPQFERPNQNARETEEAFAFREQQYWLEIDKQRSRIQQVRDLVEERFTGRKPRKGRVVRLGL